MWDYSCNGNINASESLYTFADTLIFMKTLQSTTVYFEKSTPKTVPTKEFSKLVEEFLIIFLSPYLQ